MTYIYVFYHERLVDKYGHQQSPINISVTVVNFFCFAFFPWSLYFLYLLGQTILYNSITYSIFLSKWSFKTSDLALDGMSLTVHRESVGMSQQDETHSLDNLCRVAAEAMKAFDSERLHTNSQPISGMFLMSKARLLLTIHSEDQKLESNTSYEDLSDTTDRQSPHSTRPFYTDVRQSPFSYTAASQYTHEGVTQHIHQGQPQHDTLESSMNRYPEQLEHTAAWDTAPSVGGNHGAQFIIYCDPTTTLPSPPSQNQMQRDEEPAPDKLYRHEVVLKQNTTHSLHFSVEYTAEQHQKILSDTATCLNEERFKVQGQAYCNKDLLRAPGMACANK